MIVIEVFLDFEMVFLKEAAAAHRLTSHLGIGSLECSLEEKEGKRRRRLTPQWYITHSWKSKVRERQKENENSAEIIPTQLHDFEFTFIAA